VIRRHRFALAFLAVLATILFVAPLARREVFQVRDHFDYFQPLRWFTAAELREGRLPLWNPYSASGEPWLANPQTGIFYPPAWLFLALPFETAYMLYLLLHLVLLAWSAYLLFARDNSGGAAMIGAAALLFSGPLLSLLDVSNNLASFAWLPLVLWCAREGAWRRGGIALAMTFLAGEPFVAAIAALLYVCMRRHRDVLGTAAIAFGLSAFQLLPFLEWVRGSDRTGGMDASQVLRNSMPIGEWLRVVVPPQLFDAPQQQSFIPALYGGGVVALLAIAGLVRLRRRRDLVAWAIVLVVAIVISTGPLLLASLPLTLFRYPARLVPFGMFAIAAFAAAGWDRVRRDKRWLDLVLVAIVAGDLLPHAMPLVATGPFRPDVIPYDRSIGATQKFVRIATDDRARIESIGGYLNLYERRFDADTAAPLIDRAYLASLLELQRVPSRGRIDAFSIGYVVTPRDLPRPLTRIARASNTNVYAVPRMRAMAVSIAGPRVTPLPWEMSTSRMRVTVDAAEPSLVAVSQRDGPGWSVTIDGKPAEKRRFSEVFRAVEVSAGHHEIVWTYHPRSFFFGVVMTLVTLIAMTFSVFVKDTR
jgi:hypothetical protein